MECKFCKRNYRKLNHESVCKLNPNRVRFHFLYKTTCQISGRFYVGVHSTFDLDDGYLGSGTILKNSLKCHGVKNHKREILEFFTDPALMFAREREIITEEFISDPLCMNIKVGGNGGWELVNESGRNFMGIKNLLQGSKSSAMIREDWKRNDPKRFEEYRRKISESLKKQKLVDV